MAYSAGKIPQEGVRERDHPTPPRHFSVWLVSASGLVHQIHRSHPITPLWRMRVVMGVEMGVGGAEGNGLHLT